MHFYARVEDLLGLDHHLPLLLGSTVLHEGVDMRNDVERDLLGESLPLDRRIHVDRAGLIEQLVHRLAAGAGDGLVGGDDDAPDARNVMQRLQRHHHLHGGAIRIGDDVAPGIAGQGLRVYLGHDERHIRVHAELRGVVDDDGARRRRLGRVDR